MSTIIPRFAYRIDVEEGGEHFFRFPKLPDIISSMNAETFSKMDPQELHNHLADAMICALAARMITRQAIPEGDADTTLCDGFVDLTVEEAMKVALYQVYQANFRSVAEFASKIGKHETAARRLLNLRHKSRPDEIVSALEHLGKRLHHEWQLIAA